MMIQVGDQYRPRVYYVSVEEAPNTERDGLQNYRTYISYPASHMHSHHTLKRMEFNNNHKINLQGIIFNQVAIPEDAEPMPEKIVFEFKYNTNQVVDDLDAFFEEHYGDIISVRSEAHCRNFWGIIPYWAITVVDDNSKDITIEMDVKESFAT